jgi:hypothetical protein
VVERVRGHVDRAHDGSGLERGTGLPGSGHVGDPPAEVNDPRPLALAGERDAAVVRADLFGIQPAD